MDESQEILEAFSRLSYKFVVELDCVVLVY